MALGNPTDDIILKIKAEKNDASKSVKSLREELRAAVQEGVAISRQFGDNSKEAGKAAAKVAQLRDEMDDFNQKVKALNPDKFARFATATNGIVNGFQAAQGAAVLFGAESEDLQKTMVKLQAVMAFSQGIQGVLDAKKAFGGLGTTIKTTVVAAFTTLRGAIIATGIGALVVGVGLLIQNFDKVKKYILNLFPGLGKLGDFIGGLVDAFTDFVGITTKGGRALEEMIEKSEKALKKNEGWLDRNLDKFNKHSQEKLKIQQATGEKLLELDKKFAEDKNSADFLQQRKEILDQHNRLITKANEARKTENQIEIDRKKEEARKAEEARQSAIKTRMQEYSELQAGLTMRKTNADDNTKAIIDMHDKLLKEREKYDSIVVNKNLIATQREREYRKALSDIATTASVSLIQSLQELNTAFAGKSEAAQKKAFQRNKALAIAETVISTYSAATKAYEAAFNPPTYASFVVGPVMAGVAIAAGLAKLATISKTTFMGSGGGGSSASAGGSGGGGGTTMPAAATGFSFVKAPPPQGGDKGFMDLPAQKVFVVSKDITATQSKDTNIYLKAVVK